jgi:GNAT superfamily N-acetyltransferase
VVREVSPDDWQTLREAPFTEEQWRGRISDRSVTFFAYLSENPEPAGLAGVYVQDGVADVVSMWVRPSARGHGVGEALIGATADWAKTRDHACLLLWVTESNTPARKLYDRCGFAPPASASRSPRIRPCPRSGCAGRSTEPGPADGLRATGDPRLAQSLPSATTPPASGKQT